MHYDDTSGNQDNKDGAEIGADSSPSEESTSTLSGFYIRDTIFEEVEESPSYLLSPYGDLTIAKVELEHDGTYKCAATNAIGSEEAFAVLTVQGRLFSIQD